MIAGIEAFFRSPPDGTRAVVLHGEGSNFSAGLDLSNVAEISVAEGISDSRAWHRAFEQIEYGQVPVVAVMHGAVIGGGLEIAGADPETGLLMESLMAAIAETQDEARTRLRNFLEKRATKVVHHGGMPETIMHGDRSRK